MNTSPESLSVKLSYCLQDGVLRPIQFFDSFRGMTIRRPDNLVCPCCGDDVVVRLSEQHLVADHFAHRAGNDCVITRRGESAIHLNAKAKLSKKLEEHQALALLFRCSNCRNIYTYVKVERYDKIRPEFRFGTRRPDIGMLLEEKLKGAVEVKYLHGVTEEKIADFNQAQISWFEIPAQSVQPQIFQYWESAAVAAIDTHKAGITYPLPPTECAICEERRVRRERFNAVRLAETELTSAKQRGADLTTLSILQNRFETAQKKAIELDESAEEKAAREALLPKPFLNSAGVLVIPINCHPRYCYWAGGQSLKKTLLELKAPPEIIEKYCSPIPEYYGSILSIDD